MNICTIQYKMCCINEKKEIKVIGWNQQLVEEVKSLKFQLSLQKINIQEENQG